MGMSETQSPERDDAAAPQTLSLTAKLWLGFGALIAIVVLGAFGTYWNLVPVVRDLTQMVETAEPLARATLEMKVNAGSAERAVLNYVRDSDPSLLGPPVLPYLR